MNVSANLLEYLKKNDSAELIGIGTFRVLYTHASMSPITNTLTPPSRTITFVNELNDDLSFVKEMAKNEFISVETAMKWIQQYSDSVKERIESSNVCKLGDLGTLSKGISKGYSFTPKEGQNLLDTAFAFSTLKSVKTFDQEDFIKPIITKEPSVEEPIEEEKKIENIEKVVVGTYSNIEEKTNNEINSFEEKEKSEQSHIQESGNSLNLEQIQEKEIVFEERKAIERDEHKIKEAQEEVEKRLKELKDNDEENKDEFDFTNSEQYKKDIKEIKEKKKKEKKQNRKRNKKIWKALFIIVLIILFAFGGLVFAHYMCWLKNIKQLEPITLRLNNFITPKCDKQSQKAIVVPVAKPKVQVVETPTTEIETPTTQAVEPAPVAEVKLTAQQKEKQKIEAQKKKIAKEKAKKEAAKLKPTGEKDNPPAPTAEIDYSTPITVQQVSRLGFDVVGGTFADKANAQQASRKARSLGYDSYIISKFKDNKPIYYVSYGSRRSMKEASDFMKKISQRSGDSGFYIISR